MDMREMVDKVKKGEPLYGHTNLSPYMQGVAARNSRYSALMAQVIPWANFVNHNQVCTSIDTREFGGANFRHSMESTQRSITNRQSENSKQSDCRRGLHDQHD